MFDVIKDALSIIGAASVAGVATTLIYSAITQRGVDLRPTLRGEKKETPAE